MAFTEYAAKPRKILRCACCDDVSDLPAGWDVTPDFGQIGERLDPTFRRAKRSADFRSLYEFMGATATRNFTCPPPEAGGW